MASEPFIDLSTLDLNRLILTQEQIYQHLPHRYEFMQLNGLVHQDIENRLFVALREVRTDEFWVKGHIPGRPLMPGVLMIETAAQLAALATIMITHDERFLGFGGVDAVKFRGTVVPPGRMYILMKLIEMRPRRVIGDAQGILDGKLVFEARITGMPV